MTNYFRNGNCSHNIAKSLVKMLSPFFNMIRNSHIKNSSDLLKVCKANFYPVST